MEPKRRAGEQKRWQGERCVGVWETRRSARREARHGGRLERSGRPSEGLDISSAGVRGDAAVRPRGSRAYEKVVCQGGHRGEKKKGIKGAGERSPSPLLSEQSHTEKRSPFSRQKMAGRARERMEKVTGCARGRPSRQPRRVLHSTASGGRGGRRGERTREERGHETASSTGSGAARALGTRRPSALRAGVRPRGLVHPLPPALLPPPSWSGAASA